MTDADDCGSARIAIIGGRRADMADPSDPLPKTLGPWRPPRSIVWTLLDRMRDRHAIADRHPARPRLADRVRDLRDADPLGAPRARASPAAREGVGFPRARRVRRVLRRVELPA